MSVDLKDLGLIGQEPVQNESMSDEEAAVALMESINRSLTTLGVENRALQVEVRALQNRVSTLETFVSYLLDKDPGVMERMKAMAAAVESEKAGDEKQ